MTGVTMAGAAVLILVVLWLRGGAGRLGLVLAVLAGAALAGLADVADLVWQGATVVSEVAGEVGQAANQDWGAKG